MNFAFNLLNSLEILKKYQLEIDILFRHVSWIDLMTGEIILTEELINKEYKPLILKQLPDYIKHLEFTLVEDLIRIDLIGHMKAFAFKVCCDMTLETFEFTADSHKLVLALHNESVTAEKGIINKILMRIMNRFFIGKIGRTMVHRAIEKQPWVTFDHDRKTIAIDLEYLPQFQKYFELAVLGKPLITLVEMELMGLNKQGIRFKLLLLKPPIPSMKEVGAALGL